MARIRTIKPGTGIIHPDDVIQSKIAYDELRWNEGLVYRFINKQGECIYIGITENPLVRWQAHRRKKWWTEVAAIYYTAGLPVYRAWSIEREDILSECPKHNMTVSHR